MTPRRAGRLAGLLLTCAMVLTACGPSQPLTLPEDIPETEPPPTASERPTGRPAGRVVVAYPDVPASWHGVEGDDLAATDLFALWGLPLYRYGPDGVLRPGLAAASRVGSDDGSWWVEIELREGEWTDGVAVTADDVLATIELLSRGPREAEFAVVEATEAVDDRTVRLVFAEPYGRWAHLLSGAPGVLPAQVIRDGGLESYGDGLPVVGGWFELREYEPGLRAIFAAHGQGPLGPPGVETVEVLFTPRYETALGLLDEGRVDAVAGHTALNPVGRAERLEERVEAAAPLGGTLVALEWDDDVDIDVRRSISAVVDVSQLAEGLLGGTGEVATSPWPGTDGPWPRSGREEPPTRSIGTLRVVLPRGHEVTGFTSRALQRDATVLEGTLELLSFETPLFVEEARADADVVLRIRRSGPRPALADLAEAVTPAIRAADASALPSAPAVTEGMQELRRQSPLLPLYRVGVAHVWSDDLEGVRPSSWPGVGFWNAGEWRMSAP